MCFWSERGYLRNQQAIGQQENESHEVVSYLRQSRHVQANKVQWI